MRSNPAFERTDTIVTPRAGTSIFSVLPAAAGAVRSTLRRPHTNCLSPAP